MTADEAREATARIDRDIASLQKHFGDHFEGARGPLRDHCYGYSCGVGVAACVTVTDAMRQLRVALMRVERANREMSATQ